MDRWGLDLGSLWDVEEYVVLVGLGGSRVSHDFSWVWVSHNFVRWVTITNITLAVSASAFSLIVLTGKFGTKSSRIHY